MPALGSNNPAPIDTLLVIVTGLLRGLRLRAPALADAVRREIDDLAEQRAGLLADEARDLLKSVLTAADQVEPPAARRK